MIEILIARVFTARNMSHLTHWKETSGYRHETLGDFYDDVISALDKVVEVYQCAFGLVKVPMLPQADLPKDIVKFLEADMKWIADNRTKIAQGVTAIENLIDGLSEVYMKTLYKLKNLS